VIRTAARLFVLALVLLTTACGQDRAPAGDSGQTRTVQHVMGSTAVPAQPQRVAVLWRPTLAAVVELGGHPVAAMGEAAAPDKGLTPFLPAGYQVGDLAIVASSREVNFEQLAAARPDLILATKALVDSERRGRQAVPGSGRRGPHRPR
jgi:iron complex transport system substrate-binding protein